MGRVTAERGAGAMRQTTRATVAKARKLRREMTPPEAILWQILRTRPAGLKFRRQHPIGPFVADFYCPSRKLIIEVDGIAHAMGDTPQREARRDEWLRSHGYQNVRIPAVEVSGDLEAVLNFILGV